jgi:hypothetical protein
MNASSPLPRKGDLTEEISDCTNQEACQIKTLEKQQVIIGLCPTKM